MDMIPSLKFDAKRSSIVSKSVMITPMAAETDGQHDAQSIGRNPSRLQIPLPKLTKSSSSSSAATATAIIRCKEDLSGGNTSKVWIDNKKALLKKTTAAQQIPFYIHQTSKSRCMHPEMAAFINDSWRNLTQYNYYFHDDEAVWRLLHQPWPEFPQLLTMIHCLKSMTAVSDMWRLLVLWEYGGIYADLDCIPNSWTPSTIKPDDDAYFVIEFYNTPSQYFMAASPRHPLVYYAIHQALNNLMVQPNNLGIDASLTTGPFALLDGFTKFTLDNNINAGKRYTKPLVAGLYYGKDNRSARLDGLGRENSSDIIKREAYGRNYKKAMYAEMNMTHFLQDKRKGKISGKLGRMCYAVAYDLTVGPPDWYVPHVREDRTTVGGTS